jgi:hypothetical protein
LSILFWNEIVILGQHTDENRSYDYVERFLRGDLDDTPQSACICINNALRKSFYNTFFREDTDFVTEWNQLAGRSTTKTQDIPLMLTTLLNLDCILPTDHSEPAEMFQSILLCLKQIPLSLFFNNGSKYDDPNRPLTRWIPTAIGPDMLTSTNMATVQPDCFSYMLSPGGDVTVYTTDVSMPFGSQIYLRTIDDGAVYVMESTSTNSAENEIQGFTSTCFILENADLTEYSDARRGAYFRFQSHESSGTKCESILAAANIERGGFYVSDILRAHPAASNSEQ